MLKPETADWLHLKQYGYAPGGYLSRCFTCMQIIEFMDKRAICCRPCAEEKHAARSPTEQQPKDKP